MKDLTITIVGLFLGTIIALVLGHVIFFTYLKPDIEVFKQRIEKEHKDFFKNAVEK